MAAPRRSRLTHTPASIPTEWQSYLNAFVYIAFAIGVVLAAVLNERIGRRWTLMAASFWAVISLVIMVTATTREQLLAGRLCNFVYIGAEIVVLPLYQAEISPPAVRGFFVGQWRPSGPHSLSWATNTFAQGHTRLSSYLATSSFW